MTALENKANLSHHVTRELGRAIVCGEYSAAATFPTEAELSQKFGVSRTAVREAVKMLSAKGLVSSKPRQGIRIMAEEDWNILDPDLLQWSLEGNPTRRVLTEFFQMRVAIEPEAAALSAVLARPEHKLGISAALERMRESAPNSPVARAADIDFHVAILYATQNRFYIRMRDFIRTALNVSIRFTEADNSHYGETVDAHAKVFRAIDNGQADRASKLMRNLVNDALVRIRSDSVLPE